VVRFMWRVSLVALPLVVAACGRVVDVAESVATTITVTGNNQTANAGQALAATPTVTVLDQDGKTMTAVPVTIAVTAGGGTIANAPATTGATGTVAVGQWTLGRTPGVNVLTVTAGGRVTKSIIATSVAGAAAKVVLKSGGTAISGVVGFTVATNVVVQVLDAADNPVQGATVVTAASNGGSGVLLAPLTDATGTATLTRWLLGSLAGTQTMTIGVEGITPVTISATVRAGQAVAITPTMSLPITGRARAPGAVPLAVRAVDSYGNLVPGAIVTFAIRDGGGTIVGASSAATNASGVATAGTWTLGATFAQQSVLASTPGATALLTGQVTSEYQASMRLNGAVDDAVRLAAQRALDRLRMAVVGHLDDVPVFTVNLGGCGVLGMDPITETIHDIVFILQVAAIDGAGGTTVRATSCLNRVNLTGQIVAITVDAADAATILADGTIDSAILHEMLHGLGFGGTWSISLISAPGSPDPRFVGASATTAFLAAGGTSTPGVPIENVGPAGIIYLHWRSALFGDELMSGTGTPGQGRPLSAITLQSLTDIGYTVNPAMADPFTFLGPAAVRRSARNP
jgi:hypothetical protein